jgi:hypothetical protein
MAGLRRTDRERVALPCSEFMWMVLQDAIDPLHDERFMAGREFDERWGDEAFAVVYENAIDELAPEVLEQALAAFVHEHPGRRPRWWWESRAPEPRQRVSGRMLVRPSQLAGGYWCEVPAPDDIPRLESSAAYLRRHGLLLAGEERRLRPRDFEPEPEQAVEHLHAMADGCNCAQYRRGEA